MCDCFDGLSAGQKYSEKTRRRRGGGACGAVRARWTHCILLFMAMNYGVIASV